VIIARPIARPNKKDSKKEPLSNLSHLKIFLPKAALTRRKTTRRKILKSISLKLSQRIPPRQK